MDCSDHRMRPPNVAGVSRKAIRYSLDPRQLTQHHISWPAEPDKRSNRIVECSA